jgi:hypothetical protein
MSPIILIHGFDVVKQHEFLKIVLKDKLPVRIQRIWGKNNLLHIFLGMQMVGLSNDQLKKLKLHQPMEINNHPISP